MNRAGRDRAPALLVVLLASVTALSALSIDTYLPAFPELARDLGSSAVGVQLSLGALMVGLAAGQAFAGPLSDSVGRRRPILVALALFAAASLLCAVAPSMPALIAARLLQGIAAGASIVVARAVLRDTYSGPRLARAFSTLMLVMSVAPLIGPSLGAALQQVASWRGVFAFLAAYGALLLFAVRRWLRETLPPPARSRGGLRELRTTVGRLLGDRLFLGYALAAAFGTAAVFAYVGGSSFVLQELYGLSPGAYAVVFSINASGFVGAALVNRHLVLRVPLRSLLHLALILLTIGGVALLAVASLDLGLAFALPAFFVTVASLGLTLPNAAALALAEHEQEAGTASALLGVFQFALSAPIVPLAGIAGTDTALPLAVIVAAGGVCGLAALRFARRPAAALDVDPARANA